MGYRLELSEVKYTACGGKLYGYVDDETKLKSYKWLEENNFLNGEEYWDYGSNVYFEMRPEQFREFIKLYDEDYYEYHDKKEEYRNAIINDKNIQKLMNSDNFILVEWW